MALETLGKLIHGDSSILESYIKVKNKWDELLLRFDWRDKNALEKLTKLVGDNQWSFELVAGERWLGQEIMVIVGICQFYSRDVGFDKDARKAKLIYNAFLSSYCSMEVKFHAEEIGKLYHLEDYLIDEDYETLFD